MDHEDGKGDAAQELATAMQSQGAQGLKMEPSGLMLVIVSRRMFYAQSCDYSGGSRICEQCFKWDEPGGSLA